MKHSLPVAAVLAALLGAPAMAAEPQCTPRWTAHAAAVSAILDDRGSGTSGGSGLRLGVGRDNCAVRSGHSTWELSLSANRIDGAPPLANDQVGIMLDRLRLYRLGAWQPFWQSGVGAVRDYGRDGSARWYPALQAGGGVLFELFPRGATLRLDAVVQAVWNDDAVVGEPFHPDARFGLALLLPFRSY